MGFRLPRLLMLLPFAVVISEFSVAPAHACLWMGGWLSPEDPFDGFFLREDQTIFRGRPIGVQFRQPSTNTVQGSSDDAAFENGSEITFEVLATYRGEKKEIWTVYQIGGFPISQQRDLNAFKKEIGDDFLVVLSEPDLRSKQYTDLPIVALGECGELLMRRFALMEPVLRERGFID